MLRLSLLWILKHLHKLDIHAPIYLKYFNDNSNIISEHCVGYDCWIMISTSFLINFESIFLFSSLYCFPHGIVQYRTQRYVATVLPWRTSAAISKKPVFPSSLKTHLLVFWYIKLIELINFARCHMLIVCAAFDQIESQSKTVSIVFPLFGLIPIIVLSTEIKDVVDLCGLKPFWSGWRCGSILWPVRLRIILLASFGDIEDNSIPL